MIQRSPNDLMDGMPPPIMLQSVLREHMSGCERLRGLREAYEGRSAVARRMRSPGLPNNRIAHPFARYIVAVTTGYLIGRPVAYACASASPTLDAIADALKRGSAAAVDAENARNAAIYGRGVEYVHVDAGGMPHVTALSPLDAFVVYEDGYDMRPLFGVYCIPRAKADGSPDGYRLWVMNDARVVEYHASDPHGGALTQVADTPHFFGGGGHTSLLRRRAAGGVLER